jgi:RimJ/RimL family protein N-acetyltransferase
LVTRVLVFFGGIDAGNYTSLALQALVNCHAIDWHVDVAIGAEHPNRKQLEAECQRHGFACHVDTNQMAELMAAADLMIGAGGTASWERCCVGLPALAFSVADNQRRVVEHAALHGLVYAPGRGPITASSIELHLKALVDNPRLLEMLSRNGLRAVDGLGVNRVVRALDYDSIVMREATLDDADALFAWRNHDSIRSVSRQTHPIAWPEHHAWLTDVLGNPNRTLLIGERNGEPIGVVRFDVTQGEAEASIYLVPARAGSGLGSRLLLAGESWLLAQRRDVTFFRAEVFEGNDRSHRLFQSTGYLGESTVYRKRVPPS